MSEGTPLAAKPAPIPVLNATAGATSANPEQAAEHNHIEPQANRAQLQKLFADVSFWKEDAYRAWSRITQAEAYVEAYMRHHTSEPQRSELIRILRTGA